MRALPHPAPRGPALAALALAVAAALAGCTASTPPDAIVAPTSGAEEPAEGNTTGNGTSFAMETEGNRTFAPVEHTFHMDYYAAFALPVEGAPQNTGNMGDATWDVPVPPGARSVSVTANFTSAVVVGAMSLMLHNGTAAEPGESFATVEGDAPLTLADVPLPEGMTSLVLMFHVGGEPVAAQANTDATVVATFA